MNKKIKAVFISAVIIFIVIMFGLFLTGIDIRLHVDSETKLLNPKDKDILMNNFLVLVVEEINIKRIQTFVRKKYYRMYADIKEKYADNYTILELELYEDSNFNKRAFKLSKALNRAGDFASTQIDASYFFFLRKRYLKYRVLNTKTKKEETFYYILKTKYEFEIYPSIFSI